MPLQKGDYVMVKINGCTQTTLVGEVNFEISQL